ncbi:MAG: asparagine synthase (glutamine-hydrolyzing) [Cyclobacteriaceae bacterium]
MCGIFGLLKLNSTLGNEDLRLAKQASELMIHRGPDDDGYWYDDQVCLSFRRLSIIDIGEAGHQPMLSENGKHVLIFNGELYNYLELRSILIQKGYKFRSRTDTEVVLNALIEWGTDAIPKFNGMYAFAFWDSEAQSILITRDHVGMKPLYYAIKNNCLLFGSQLDQVMLGYDKRTLSMDRMGLGLFLSVGYYPAPRTVFNEIRQLEPGKWLRVDSKGCQETGAHFDLLSFYLENRDNYLSQPLLDEALSQSVRRHLMSDVPLGTFLSGGLDSGIITGLTSKFYGKNFRAYTMSNVGTKFDETERAKAVTEYLGIKHTVVYPKDIVNTVGLFQKAFQEPFGDYSAIPSLLVTAEAKKDVKVMLSGDGSDEFFFGYNRMTSMLQASKYYNFPFLFRRLYKHFSPKTPAITFDSFPVMILKKQSWAYNSVLEDMNISDESLAHEFLKPYETKGLNRDMVIKLNSIHRYFQLQLLKLDRSSMYNSIEARVPFADKEFMRYSIAYTSKEATDKNYTVRKTPLREMYNHLYPFMNEEEGPKKGFTIDMGSLLSGQLKDYYVSSLESTSCFSSIIDFKNLRNDFLAGRSVQPFFNWSLLSLQTWSNQYIK